MKRKAILFVIAFACAVIGGHLFANRSSSVPTTHNRVLLNYVWYLDPDQTFPTGTYSDIGPELTRLRNAYPFNTFSSSVMAGLHAYEWGYYPSAPTPVIYSDLY
jgi:hypothetical protein